MKEFKALLGQTAIYGLSHVLQRVLNFLLVPIYTRVFVPQQYAIVIDVYAYTQLLLVILTYGTETGYFRFAKDKESNEKVYTSIQFSLLVTSTLFLAFVYLFKNPINGFLGYQGSAKYVLYMGWIIFFDVLSSIPFAKLRFENRPIRFAFIKFVNIGVTIVLTLIMLKLIPYLTKTGFPLPDFMKYKKPSIDFIFIINLVGSVIMMLMLIPEFRLKYKLFDKQLLKNIFVYSLPLLVAGLAGNINEVADRILLKEFCANPNKALYYLGIYGANLKVAQFMMIIIQAYRFAADPFFFKNADKQDSKKIYARTTEYFFYVCLLFLIVLLVFDDLLIQFIGKKYHEGKDIIPILLISNLMVGLLYSMSVWYKVANKTYLGALITCTGCLITILLNIWLIPKYNYYAVSWVRFISNLVMIIMSYYLMRKYYYIPYRIKRTMKYILMAVIIVYSAHLLNHHKILKYIAGSTGIVLYILYFYKFEFKRMKRT